MKPFILSIYRIMQAKEMSACPVKKIYIASFTLKPFILQGNVRERDVCLPCQENRYNIFSY